VEFASVPAVTGADVAARARALVGTRFRPQGRRPEHGLDCLGLVAAAGGLPGEAIPSAYSLRSEVEAAALSMRIAGRAEPLEPNKAGEGDVLLVQAGIGQHHFLVLVEGGFVHADARLGKVVDSPGAVPWPALAAWRITGAD
jgi:cell wall-associated NlpC family hydrolase